MRSIVNHIMVPLILSVIFFVVASLPVEVLGCRNRSIFAALLAIVAGIVVVIAAVVALVGRVRGDLNSFWWMGSALILAISAIFIAFISI